MWASGFDLLVQPGTCGWRGTAFKLLGMSPAPTICMKHVLMRDGFKGDISRCMVFSVLIGWGFALYKLDVDPGRSYNIASSDVPL